MNKEKLKQIEEFIQKNSSERDWIHVRQIRPIAQNLANKEGANKEVIDIAILFHDIGKSKVSEEVHEFESEKIARDFLEKLNFDKGFIEKVCKAIIRHAGPWKEKGEQPQTIEEKIVFDADLIQQRSPFGIMKHIEYVKDKSNFVKMVTELRDRLEKIDDKVLTESGKELLKGKILFVQDFFKEVLK
jgi:uncharacterized protein